MNQAKKVARRYLDYTRKASEKSGGLIKPPKKLINDINDFVCHTFITNILYGEDEFSEGYTEKDLQYFRDNNSFTSKEIKEAQYSGLVLQEIDFPLSSYGLDDTRYKNLKVSVKWEDPRSFASAEFNPNSGVLSFFWKGAISSNSHGARYFCNLLKSIVIHEATHAMQYVKHEGGGLPARKKKLPFNIYEFKGSLTYLNNVRYLKKKYGEHYGDVFHSLTGIEFYPILLQEVLSFRFSFQEKDKSHSNSDIRKHLSNSYFFIFLKDELPKMYHKAVGIFIDEVNKTKEKGLSYKKAGLIRPDQKIVDEVTTIAQGAFARYWLDREEKEKSKGVIPKDLIERFWSVEDFFYIPKGIKRKEFSRKDIERMFSSVLISIKEIQSILKEEGLHFKKLDDLENKVSVLDASDVFKQPKYYKPQIDAIDDLAPEVLEELRKNMEGVEGYIPNKSRDKFIEARSKLSQIKAIPYYMNDADHYIIKTKFLGSVALVIKIERTLIKGSYWYGKYPNGKGLHHIALYVNRKNPVNLSDLNFVGDTVRHELVHAYQEQMSLNSGSPSGLPFSKKDPRYHQHMIEKQRELRIQYAREGLDPSVVDFHALDDIEFYSRLLDEVVEFQKKIPNPSNDDIRKFISRRQFFISLKRFKRKNWSKAVGIFIDEVNKTKEKGLSYKKASRPIRIDKTKVKELTKDAILYIDNIAKETKEETLSEDLKRRTMNGTIYLGSYLESGSSVDIKIMVKETHENGVYSYDQQRGLHEIEIYLKDRTIKALTHPYMYKMSIRPAIYKHIYSVLIHEITHAVERIRYLQTDDDLLGFGLDQGSQFDKTRIKTRKDKKKTLKEYYNNPKEVKAYLQQIAEEVETYLIEKHGSVTKTSIHNGLGDAFEFYGSKTWQKVSRYLSPKNKTYIRKAVFTYIVEIASDEKQAGFRRVSQRYLFARSQPAQDLGGVKTWVDKTRQDQIKNDTNQKETTPDSADGKPQRDRVLPLPSGHPEGRDEQRVGPGQINSPPDSSGQGGANRPKKDPSALSDHPNDKALHERPRSSGMPGDEYGHPYIDQSTSTGLKRRVLGSVRQLFHATRPPIVPSILRGGLIPSHSYQSHGLVQSGISTSEDFSALSKGDFGNAIFILDRSEIERNFETGDVDYWGDNREKEVRVYTDKIHPRYLKGLIFIWKPKPFEIDWMLENYDLPLYHVNKRGGFERLTEFDGKKAKKERRVASDNDLYWDLDESNELIKVALFRYNYRPPKGNERQKKQKGQAKRKSDVSKRKYRVKYRKNLLQQKRLYKRKKHNPTYKKYKKNYANNPESYKRRPGGGVSTTKQKNQRAEKRRK